MLHREDVIWAYRVILGRNPESEQVVTEKANACPNMIVLRDSLLASQEYLQSTTPRGKTEILFDDCDGDRYCLDLTDHAISRQIMAGEYEPEVLSCIKDIVTPDSICFDVGANIGYFAIKLDRLGAYTIALEPVPYLFDRLWAGIRERSRSNPFTNINIFAFREAAGAEAGEMVMIHAPATINPGGAYLAPKGTVPPPNHVAEPTPVVTLDSYLHGNISDVFNERKVQLIKLDVEGAEPLAMKGAIEMVDRFHPIVIAEIHRQQYLKVSGQSPEEFVRFMQKLGYPSCHMLGVGQAARLNPAKLPDYCNALFVP
jgi:FkbM family methyltransferase